jgi:GTP cyclohydrolase FolE2
LKASRHDRTALADVQNSEDERRLAIDKVGIKAIRHPVRVRNKSGGVQHTIAEFGMYVGLPQHFKGTHMSRFIAILNGNEREIPVESIGPMLREMVARLEAETAGSYRPEAAGGRFGMVVIRSAASLGNRSNRYRVQLGHWPAVNIRQFAV